MQFFFDRITHIFDPLHHWWEHEKILRRLSFILVLVFLGGMVGIELKRRGLMPEPWADITPDNHFYAVNLAFSLVLILEVISFIFTLPCSFSRSVGKQFEILTLILLRDSFKELTYFVEPITITAANTELILSILADGFGALIIFMLLGVYYRLQPFRKTQTKLPADLYRFVAAKKGIALLILGVFVGLGLTNLFNMATGRPHIDFFSVFYTMLIFTDILVILVSQCFRPTFHAVFRNSGYALSTLFIRLALAAPPFYNVALGIASIIFAIGLTVAWTRIFTDS